MAMSHEARARQELYRRPTGEYGDQVGVHLPGEIALDTGADTAPQVRWDSEDARSTRHIDQWWTGAFRSGEYDHRGNVARMPDDNTPSMSSGRSVLGHRRTYRMRYEVGGASFRMPSRTAIHRFMGENNLHAVDVPVVMTSGQHSVQMFVRVTSNGNGQYEASTRGADGNLDLRVAESVAAIMENRHAEVESIDDLFARRDARRALYGVRADTPVSSRFISSLGYENGLLTVAMGDKAYTYPASEATFIALRDARAPGRVYNTLVKDKDSEALRSMHCTHCGRFAGDDHVCPVSSPRVYASSTFVQHVAARTEASPAPHSERPSVSAWASHTAPGNTGWTRHAISSVLYDYSSPRSVPEAYRDQKNGSDGVLAFAGLHRPDLDKVVSLMPPGERQKNEWMLAAAARPGVSVGGYVSSPQEAEGVDLSRLTFDDPNLAREIGRNAVSGDSRQWRSLMGKYSLPGGRTPLLLRVNHHGDVEAVF